MGIRLINYVNNQLQTPALYTDSFANRPPAGIYGRLFISSNTFQIFQDQGSGWSLLADAGSGSSNLQQVTFNGNTTPYGIVLTGSDLTLTGTGSAGYIYIANLTSGAVLFPDGGRINQDTTNFVWDNTNKRLGLGTSTPSAKLDIHSSTNLNATFNGTGVTNATLQFQNAGTSKWTIGNYYSSGVANDFNIYDNVNSAYRLQIHNTGVINVTGNLIIGSTTPSTSYGLDVYNSANFRSNILGTSATFSSTIGTAGDITITKASAASFIANNTSASGKSYRLFSSDDGKFYIQNTGVADLFTIASTGAATFSNIVGIGISPTLNLTVQGLYGLPSTSGTQTTGIFRVQDSASNIALDMGVIQNTGNWIQSLNKANSAVLPLALNPNGGQIQIGGATNTYIDYTTNTARFYGGASTNTFGLGANNLIFFQGDASQFYPTADNTRALGAASYRYTTVYATTALINTSDYNDKEQIENLTELEKNVAVKLKGLIKKFKFKDAVILKEDKARLHIGVIAQEVEQAFKEEGLDANEYGLFCSDTWWELDGILVDKNTENAIKKNKLGIRYEELITFIISQI